MPQTRSSGGLVPLDEETFRFLSQHVKLPSPLKRQAHASWYRFEDKDTKKKTPAKVYIYDQIGESFWGEGVSSKKFIKELDDLDESEFDLHINSPGGAIFEGVAIYNAIKRHKAEVTVYIDALAASAASFVAQAGDKIIICRNAEMMIHDGKGIVLGTAADMRKVATTLDRLSNNIADIYAQRAGENVDYWRNLMIEETWYNANEAVTAKLADEMTDAAPEGIEEDESVEDMWDLSVFNYTGRSHAPSPTQVRETVLANLATKEASVPPSNENQNPAQVPTSPAQPTTEPTTRPEEPVPPAADPPADPAPVADPPADPPADEPEPEARMVNGQVQFMLNGAPTSDIQAVQSYINSLEAAQRETQQQNRKNFVKSLCDNKKILASQVTAMEEFALDLSNEAYQKWVATWNVAAPLAALATSVNGVTNPTPPQLTQDDELDIAEGIVKQNMLVNMPQEQLEKTPSWLKLKAANALDRVGKAS